MESSRSQEYCGCGHSRARWASERPDGELGPVSVGRLLRMVMWALELRREANCVPERLPKPLAMAPAVK
jgi:hypothetical protein